MAPVIAPLVAVLAPIVGATAAYVLATVSVTVGVQFVLGKVQSLIAGKPREAPPPAQQVTITDTSVPDVIIYGETRVSGVVAFYGTSGTNNEYLWYVIALAHHQVDSILDVWLDGVMIPSSAIDGSGQVTSGQYAGKVYIWRRTGGSTATVLTQLDDAFASWTSAHVGKGVAHLVVRMQRDQDVFPNGAPRNYYARVRGKRLYDPSFDSTNGGTGSHRLNDPSTWTWSNVSALVAADYITGGHRVFDVSSIDPNLRMGLNDDPSRIDWAAVAAAKIKCQDSMTTPEGTESRYVFNGALSAAATHSENMNKINATMAGVVAQSAGMHLIYPGQYDSPAISISDDDLVGDYRIDSSLGMGSVYNAVSAIYTDQFRDWQQVTSYVRTNTSYEAADGRRELQNLELTCVNGEFQAQRLCEIENRRGRNQTTITLKLGWNGFKLRIWDTFNLTLSELGWSNKVFRVTKWGFNPAGPVVSIVAREELAAVYTDLSSGDYNNPSRGALGNQYELPDAPQNLTTQGLANAILIDWDQPVTFYANTVYVLEESTSSAMTSPAEVYRGADSQATLQKAAGTVRYYRVRAERAGQVSAWTPLMGGVSGAPSSTSSALSAVVEPGTATATVSTSTAATNSVTVTAAGGTPSYGYAWTFASGGTGITIDANTSSTTTFSATGLAAGEQRTGIAQCVVTDGVSATYTVQVAVTITRESFTVNANNVYKAASGFSSNGTFSTGGASPNVTPVSGTGPYTYAWAHVSTASGNTPTVSSASAQNPTWAATVFDGTPSISAWSVTVTDTGTGAIVAVQITVTLNWTNLS